MANLFEEVPDSEIAHLTERSRGSKKVDTTDRSLIGWYKLNHRRGYCTCPLHPEVQAELTDNEREIRQTYPVRYVFTIGNYDVCRDCYTVEADIEATNRNLPPLDFSDQEQP